MRFAVLAYLLSAVLICLFCAPAAFADTATVASPENGAARVETSAPAPAKTLATEKPRVWGEFGLRLQTIYGDIDSSKFREYRDLRNGLQLSYLQVADQSVAGKRRLLLSAQNIGLKDGHASLSYEDIGALRAEVYYDAIPHRFSNTARTIFHEGPDNVFRLDPNAQAALQSIATTDINPKQAGVQIDTTAFGNLVNSLEHPVKLEVDRKTVGFRSTYTPTPKVSYYASFSDERRTGHKGFGTSFGFSNLDELPVRIDFDTQDFALGAEYTAARGVLQLQLNHNRFEDRDDTLIWDNPINNTDQPIPGPIPNPLPDGYSVSSVPAHGRMPLAPGNTTDDITLNGAYRFSDKARLTGSFSQGAWRQDADFVPMTINSALLSTFPDITTLPADSLNGKIETALQQLAFNYDAASNLALTARYRRYAVKNKTRSLAFNGVVLFDTTLEVGTFETEYPDITVSNTGLDLVWRPLRKLNARLTGEQEVTDRTHRDVKQVRENTIKASLDYHFTDVLLLRANSAVGNRRIRGHYEVDPEAEFVELRRYDEANRHRSDNTFMLQFLPNERFDASFVVRSTADRYPDSPFGVKNETLHDMSIDWNYSAGERTTLYGGAGLTQLGLDLCDRYRPVPDPNYDPNLDNWFSRQRDNSRAVWFGINRVVVPKKLTVDFALSYNRDYSKTRLKSVPGGNASGNGADWPSVRYSYLAPSLSLDYTCSPDRVLRLAYYYERYTERDFQYDIMQPYMGIIDPGAPTGIFLGSRVPGYTGHIVSLQLQQRF
jgi:MtrB/PioB family decaheme-associated outer membrane protein